MKTKRVISAVLCGTLCLVITLVALAEKSQAAPPVRMYNTAKEKLMAGGAIVGGTVSTSDPNIYCAMANAGFDFTWIEMQHSPLMFNEVARMIWACRGAGAIPFIRVPDATEGAIQKATDIGALGIVVPMVATAEKPATRSNTPNTRPWDAAAGAAASTEDSGAATTATQPTTTSW